MYYITKLASIMKEIIKLVASSIFVIRIDEILEGMLRAFWELNRICGRLQIFSLICRL